MQISNKHSLLIGFVLSLISIGLNSVAISYIGQRLKSVDEEYSRLTEALDRQAAGLDDADSTWDRYRLMHNLVYALPREKIPDAHSDAMNLLNSALTKLYAAANDITTTQLQNVEVEEADPSLDEKGMQLERELRATSDPETKRRLKEAQDNLGKSRPEPKSELGRKLRELEKYVAAEDADDDLTLHISLLPLMKSLRQQILTSVDRRHNRMQELENDRAMLVRRSGYATYAALALQMLGLMFIVAKDLLKDLNQKKVTQGSTASQSSPN